ncbi:FG-GAP-like repeat-containing protein [Rhodopirellula sp. MGV]|uniref:FG-GAP-like repeat-containing protein n=1 Tax=Rhodopirellula sp. MGV TaxID=2023130 RepID=UPI000B95E915|nr:FG-GAP-like repeat-containing protein [Rhodopirellula sp. MGV]OYP38260.1 hypothetical protein CGZ80_03325 [Rhodopirellula sp. MGV]PNY38598.1 RNA-binding protein [Rhodopirellula baltica]
MNVSKATSILCQRTGIVVVLTVANLLFVISIGCDSTSSKGDGDSPSQLSDRPQFANAEGSLKIATRKGNWTEAYQAAEYLATNSPNGIDGLDPNVLVLMSQAAFQKDHKEQSANWLVTACGNERYANAGRVRQAMIALIGIGKFHEGISFLEQAIAQNPDQNQNRRWLFDFYIGSENRVPALRHGQALVRARQIDVELLQSMSNTERRFLDSAPLSQMVDRNPDDKRPLLGEAKKSFDQSKFDQAIATLQQITESHPKYFPAQALLGQSLSAAKRFDSIRHWASQQSPGIEDYPGYWLSLGDWADHQGQPKAALRAYIEAANCKDPDVVQIWTRMATLMVKLDSDESKNPSDEDLITADFIDAVNRRALGLGRLQQLKNRFTKTGGISQAIVIDLAKSLEHLGRLWEAEAWASIATTLPEDESVDVLGYRKSLVAKLQQDTPWQLDDEQPDFEPLRTALPLPEIESVVSAPSYSEPGLVGNLRLGQAARTVVSDRFQLEDEAQSRGLTFWGRTSETLDQPGIMLYQTLGCGGGTIDFDLDGNSDLYLVAAGGTPPNRDSEANELFRNLGGEFVACGNQCLADDRGFGQGVAIGDVNEDGFPDVLVLNYGPNRLFVNQGDGTFYESDKLLPPEPDDEWSSSAAIADLDGDGLNDIVIVNYCDTLGPVTVGCPVTGMDFMRSCSPMKFAARDDRFLHANGDGTFVDVSSKWNATLESPGRGLGIVAGDLDGQPGVEVFIANDMTANHYWGIASRSDVADQPIFSETAMLRGLAGDDRGIPMGSMGIATADIDRDGDLDLYVTNFSKEINTLHMQAASGIWQDSTSQAGLSDTTLPLVAFGTEAIDLDNDGILELVVTNGHVDLFSRGDEKALYQQPTQIFQQDRLGHFVLANVPSIGRYFANPHVGRSLWTLDANRDGLIDFAVTHQTEPTALIINQSPSQGDWIRLSLKGTRSSRDAVGSTVRITTPDQTLYSYRISGDGYQCSNDPVLHVGLGSVANQSVDVQVSWPDGQEENFVRVPINQESILVQGR